MIYIYILKFLTISRHNQVESRLRLFLRFLKDVLVRQELLLPDLRTQLLRRFAAELRQEGYFGDVLSVDFFLDVFLQVDWQSLNGFAGLLFEQVVSLLVLYVAEVVDDLALQIFGELFLLEVLADDELVLAVLQSLVVLFFEHGDDCEDDERVHVHGDEQHGELEDGLRNGVRHIVHEEKTI